jgi:hypothetical protein
LSKGAFREGQFSTGHNWQLANPLSFWKYNPDSDLSGIISMLDFKRTPMVLCVSPRRSNNGRC